MLTCGLGSYVTHDDGTGLCYFYDKLGVAPHGCDRWRKKSDDRLAMFCGQVGPWRSCDGLSTSHDGWVEKVGYGCVNEATSYHTKVLRGGEFASGRVVYDGTWSGCKELCRSAASFLGAIGSEELSCGRESYVTYDKESGACYFYSPQGAEQNGCERWRKKSDDRMGMYCGPESSGGELPGRLSSSPPGRANPASSLCFLPPSLSCPPVRIPLHSPPALSGARLGLTRLLLPVSPEVHLATRVVPRGA